MIPRIALAAVPSLAPAALIAQTPTIDALELHRPGGRDATALCRSRELTLLCSAKLGHYSERRSGFLLSE